MRKYFILCLVSSLAGCSQSERHDETKTRIGLSQSIINNKILSAKSGNVVSHGGYDKFVSNDLWVDKKPIIISKKEKYPKLKRRFSYIAGSKLPLTVLANDLSIATGVFFNLSPELITGVRSTTGSIETEEKESGAQTKDIDFITAIRPDWVNESIEDVINKFTNLLNISWSYDAKTNTVLLYKYISKTYRVHLTGETINQSSAMTNESLVSGGGDNGGSVSGSSISTNVSINSNPWQGLISKLDVIKSEGGKYAADMHQFTITVNDTEKVHDDVEKLIENINKSALREIVFNVTLMTVTASQKDFQSVNFESLYEKTLNSVGFSSARNIESNASTFSFINEQENVDHFEGANIFLDVLSSIGKASIVDHFEKTTLNNGIAPIMLARNRPYLRTVSNIDDTEGSSNVYSSGSSASLTDLVTGFFLTLRPHIVNDKKILVSMTLNRRSAASEFEKVEVSPEISLERPDIQDDSDFQQFTIGNNETKIIAGSVKDDLSIINSGTIDNDVWWLGGSSESGNERRKMVLFVTAKLL